MTSVVDHGKCVSPCSAVVLDPFLCSKEHGLYTGLIRVLLLGDLCGIEAEVLDLLLEVIHMLGDLRQISDAFILLISEHSVVSVANY